MKIRNVQKYKIADDLVAPGVYAGIRQTCLIIGGVLVGRGYLEDDVMTAGVAVVMIVLPLAWGQVRSYIDRKRLIVATDHAPDFIGEVERPAE